MTHTVNVTPLVDGSKRIIVHVYVKGDGQSDDLDGLVIVDPALLEMPGDSAFFTIEKIQSGLSGFSASLKFDYLTGGTLILVIPEYNSCYDFTTEGGLRDTSPELDGTGKVLISTKGLTDGEGFFVLTLRKT